VVELCTFARLELIEIKRLRFPRLLALDQSFLERLYFAFMLFEKAQTGALLVGRSQITWQSPCKK